MAGSNRVVVQINGVRYPIRTVEDPSYVAQLASEMDSAVREVTQEGRLSTNEALVLVALGYLDSCKKAEQNLANMRSQLSEYLEDATKARQEAADARRAMEKKGRDSGKSGHNA